VAATTRVHLLRHGEVDNPAGVLYGRLPDFHLSERGKAMADRIAEVVAHRDITHLVSSPLERALETAGPIAAALGIPVSIDERVIEADTVFQGQQFGPGDGMMKKPLAWRHLINPFRPSWGEPYAAVAQRMLAAMNAARDVADGQEALIVSHQLPIWTVRCFVEGRRLWHDPRKRQCTLASLTTFTYDGPKIVSVAYSEPAADLLPVKKTKKFVAGA
jgi:broad specificity phosphatase PhoE